MPPPNTPKRAIQHGWSNMLQGPAAFNFLQQTVFVAQDQLVVGACSIQRFQSQPLILLMFKSYCNDVLVDENKIII